MKKYILYKTGLVFLFLTILMSTCFSYEAQFINDVTLIYDEEDQLLQFNDSIFLKSPHALDKKTEPITVGDEIGYKIDFIIERIEKLLHVYPKNLKVSIVLLSTVAEVQEIYKFNYGLWRDYIAFYSPQNKTVFLSVHDIDSHILAHELSHVVIDQYFVNAPSTVIQESLADFVCSHIEF